ncbi:hypothetical protein [Jannaschia seohaensis]|uniref:hypothetical protein n=1 Tax=Jannaschia seohaensis TaxID=475081 RepID=UPI0011B20AB1|nr:hypothetical protein [Jannaschia seohaensis]
MSIRTGALAFLLLSFMSGLSAVAGDVTSYSGQWALDSEIPENAFVLAGRGAEGSYVVCFDAGNVSHVMVSRGEEGSMLARGSCTVFAPTAEHGILVNFYGEQYRSLDTAVALGSFRLVLRSSPSAED